MVKVKYIGKRPYKVKQWEWRADETINLPPKVVCDLILGHELLIPTFEAKDRNFMQNAKPYMKARLIKWYGLKDYHQVMDKLFGGNPALKKMPKIKLGPKKSAAPKKKPAPKKTPKKVPKKPVKKETSKKEAIKGKIKEDL